MHNPFTTAVTVATSAARPHLSTDARAALHTIAQRAASEGLGALEHITRDPRISIEEAAAVTFAALAHGLHTHFNYSADDLASLAQRATTAR